MDRHSFSQFDLDLEAVTAKVAGMGRLVERQLAVSLDGLARLDAGVADRVVETEARLDALEMEIDVDCKDLILRHAPLARDLRFVMASLKIVAHLERAGDEAERIAKRTRRVVEDGGAQGIDHAPLQQAGRTAMELLQHALAAFAARDPIAAARLIRADEALDTQFDRFSDGLTLAMGMTEGRIPAGIHFLTIAKAIERIGDLATNVAEQVVYAERGQDVRHLPVEQVEALAGSD